MLKTVLLFAFLIIALALPLTLLLTSKTNSKMLYFFTGLCIYYLSTITINFFINAWHLTEIVNLQDKMIYIVTVSLCITFFIFIFLNKILKGMDEQKSKVIYAGFAIANTFLFNLASYSNLLFISLNPTVDKLSQYYAREVAVELIDYYNAIHVFDLVLLIIEMILTFAILYSLFNDVCKHRKQGLSYVKFSGMMILLYGIMYLGLPRLMAFAAYVFMLYLTWRVGKYGVRAK